MKNGVDYFAKNSRMANDDIDEIITREFGPFSTLWEFLEPDNALLYTKS